MRRKGFTPAQHEDRDDYLLETDREMRVQSLWAGGRTWVAEHGPDIYNHWDGNLTTGG